ncbi:MAG: GNAT family N-acetyltransferase [Candidatus Dojkabacteria bacterium]
MTVRPATRSDENAILILLDEFRTDCMEQITGKIVKSNTAKTGGSLIYKSLLNRKDYCILLLINQDLSIVGIITGYLCPMLRNGQVRAEVEEFFVKKEARSNGNAKLLMNVFFEWCKKNNVQKINLESENGLLRAHKFYEKYGFEIKARRYVKKLVS